MISQAERGKIEGEPGGAGNTPYPALDPILRKGPAVHTRTRHPSLATSRYVVHRAGGR